MTVIPLADRKTAVYRLFAADNTLLYVGASHNPKERFGRHKDRAWWPEVARKNVTWYPDRRTALHREALAISKESPRYNRDRPSVYTYAPPQPPRKRNFAQDCRDYVEVLKNFDFNNAPGRRTTRAA